MDHNHGFCYECRHMSNYTLEIVEGKSEVKGEEVIYRKKKAICNDCGEELFIHEIMDENLKAIDEAYRSDKGLISIEEIREILEKYDMDGETLSILLDWPEYKIGRCIKGQLPSKECSDELYKILKDPEYIRQLRDKS